MTSFYTLLPFYLFGNLHCLGMCGPLAFMLGQHRYRFLYLLGRICAFSLAGGLAGQFGQVIYHTRFAAFSSLVFGGFFLFFGLLTLFHCPFPGSSLITKALAPLNQRMASLALKENKASLFAFGFLTIALPCGQSLAVFSASALEGSPFAGGLNGFAFAVLTTPSLFFAMTSRKWIIPLKKYAPLLIGTASLFIGISTIYREWML